LETSISIVEKISVFLNNVDPKVARQQECKMVDKIWCYRNQIAGGSFGLIFAGINEKDGRAVALKRIQQFASKHKPQTFSRVCLRLKRDVYRWKRNVSLLM
jgi:hypothetical protein